MRGMARWLGYCAGSAGVVLVVYLVFMPAFAQNSPGPGAKPPVTIAGGFDKVHALPPGGPTPHLADGHPDLTGRWYPNSAGKMLQGAYPVDPLAMRQFDPAETPEVAFLCRRTEYRVCGEVGQFAHSWPRAGR